MNAKSDRLDEVERAERSTRADAPRGPPGTRIVGQIPCAANSNRVRRTALCRVQEFSAPSAMRVSKLPVLSWEVKHKLKKTFI